MIINKIITKSAVNKSLKNQAINIIYYLLFFMKLKKENLRDKLT